MARSTVCEHCGLLFRRRGAQAVTARWCSLACRAAQTDALVIGKTFGELACLRRAGDYKWECLCACGTTVYRNAFALLGGKSKCCGCKISQRASERTRPSLAGQQYGRWTVLHWSHLDNGASYWTCRCSCGTVSKIPAANLKRGLSKSCGCLARNAHVARALAAPPRVPKDKKPRAPKQPRRPEYGVWHHMLRRCSESSNKSYANYGGRGIRVCERWGKFAAFIADMGPRPPHMTLERIDVNGNYEPSNCRWATMLEQGANKRNNLVATIDGVTRHVAEWARVSGLNRRTIEARVHRGWVGPAIISPVA